MLNRVAEYLEIPHEFHQAFEESSVEYLTDTGSSGEMDYSIYFYIPEDMDDALLEHMRWKVGDTISDLPLHIFENE